MSLYLKKGELEIIEKALNNENGYRDKALEILEQKKQDRKQFNDCQKERMKDCRTIDKHYGRKLKRKKRNPLDVSYI